MIVSNTLTKKELVFLEENGRLLVGEPIDTNTIQLSYLIENEASTYFTSIQEALGYQKNDVTASMFMKRLGFLAVNCFFSMTAFNKALIVHPENIWIDSCFEKDVWLPKIRFCKLEVEEAPLENREAWREKHFKRLFFDLYVPLIKRVSKDAKISRQTLWENVMLYIYWLYETVLPKLNVATNLKEDFQSLLEAPSFLFGMNRNPASYFYNEKVFIEKHQAEMRVRTTCCYYYQTNKEGARCSTCPLDCKVN